ncbi:hypothetical protein ACJX0J_011464, partial [Zea mays]
MTHYYPFLQKEMINSCFPQEVEITDQSIPPKFTETSIHVSTVCDCIRCNHRFQDRRAGWAYITPLVALLSHEDYWIKGPTYGDGFNKMGTVAANAVAVSRISYLSLHHIYKIENFGVAQWTQ